MLLVSAMLLALLADLSLCWIIFSYDEWESILIVSETSMWFLVHCFEVQRAQARRIIGVSRMREILLYESILDELEHEYISGEDEYRLGLREAMRWASEEW